MHARNRQIPHTNDARPQIGRFPATYLHSSAENQVMNLSLPSLSTPTLSLATIAQSIGSAATAASTALPGAGTMISSGASYTAMAARDLQLIRAPIDAAARGASRVTALQRVSAGFGKVLPWVAIGAGAIGGADMVSKHGVQSLVTTKSGRAAVLGVVGGTLLLVPTPATQLGAAGVLALSAANEFGALRRLDRTT